MSLQLNILLTRLLKRQQGVLFLFNKGSRSPSIKGFEGPTSTAVILEAAFYWKRMKISIPLNSKVEIIPLPYSCLAPTSPIYICLRSSSQAPLASRVEDIFSNLMLDHAPICFSTLNEKEKRVMMIVIQGRSMFEPGRLDVKKTLKQLLTLSFDMGGLTDPSF
uniref:Uncharacterized protein n=1 Tax=Populus alba TaxID=43335 RepID=A0A4U5QY36_POPAL|nr:hypothetical protein D5086_0000040690 [Populus alba]